MDAEGVVQVINSVGFPIVVSGALFWFVNEIMEKNTKAVNEVNATLIRFSSSIDRLTEVVGRIESMSDRIRQLEDTLSDLGGGTGKHYGGAQNDK